MPAQKSQKPLLVLIDGSSYLYRAYHALPALTSPDGHPTGALFGVVNMIKKLIRENPSPYVAVVFDAKGKTFRHDMYTEYKANRPAMPDDLASQVKPLHEIINALGIPLLIIDRVEADDVIGTLARRARETGYRVIVSTGDKDLAQLVNDDVELVNTMDDTRLDCASVPQKFGVQATQIIDYLALVGDKSDNIPGVPGVGPKTASKWLQEYGSLDRVIQNAGQIKGKIGERLRESLDILPLSYRLATIDCDVEIDIEIADLRLGKAQQKKLTEYYQRFGFNKWLEELKDDPESPEVKNVEPSTQHYEAITDLDSLQKWARKLKHASLIALDTETTSLNYMEAQLVGMSFCIKDGEAAYLPIGHRKEAVARQCSIDEVRTTLGDLLADPSLPKVGHNLKYDLSILANAGFKLAGITHDTMLESYVLNSTASRHDLDTLCHKYLNHENITFEQVAGKGAKQVTFDHVVLEQATVYAAEDADMVMRLHSVFWPQLKGAAGLRKVYSEIEIPVLRVLSRIERNGVLIDAQQLQQQSLELNDEMLVVEEQAYQLAGGKFNLGSPKQIQEVLFEKMGLPVIRKTPKGQPSTAEDVLQELALEYPLPDLILNYRSLSKLKSTYTDKLPGQICPSTGRVHTSYHQAVASTGRLSSTDPNLQNIPIRTQQGRRIRQAFVAPDGYVLLAADYSQIELRIMAHLSSDETLCDAFAHGKDIHRATAAEVFSVAIDEVSDEQRRAAKAINFGLIYGMSAFGLAKQLRIPRGEAQHYVDLYFERYPGVKSYMEDTKIKAREQGYVETLFGRRLYLPEINDRNAQRRQYAERTAINAPMQGSAADIIKKAMIAVDRWIDTQKDDIKMIMQVHDELVFELPEGHAASVSKHIQSLMSSAAELAVPLVVDCGTGHNWDEAH